MRLARPTLIAAAALALLAVPARADETGLVSALNADYWGSIIRSYFDGRQPWLSTVAGNGAPYVAGDVWGSIGAWFSGRWHDAGAEAYVGAVKDYMARRVWRTRDFAGG